VGLVCSWEGREEARIENLRVRIPWGFRRGNGGRGVPEIQLREAVSRISASITTCGAGEDAAPGWAKAVCSSLQIDRFSDVRESHSPTAGKQPTGLPAAQSAGSPVVRSRVRTGKLISRGPWGLEV